jgi:hypothetical protein
MNRTLVFLLGVLAALVLAAPAVSAPTREYVVL